MAEGVGRWLSVLGWLLVASAVVALGFLTAPALPAPPVLHPGQIPGWWSQAGPVAAAGSVLRLALLAIASGWLLFRAAVSTSRALRRLGAVTRASWTSGWTRIRSTGGLIRLALGLTSSGAVLGACGSSGHPAGDGTTVAAPVLVGPTAPAPERSTAPVRTTAPERVTAPVRATTPVRAVTPVRATAPSRTRAEAPATAAAEAVTWTVRPGEDFWSIAEAVVTKRSSGPVNDGAVASYWSRLIAANRGRLPQPGDPDLLFPGQTLVLPPI